MLAPQQTRSGHRKRSSLSDSSGGEGGASSYSYSSSSHHAKPHRKRRRRRSRRSPSSCSSASRSEPRRRRRKRRHQRHASGKKRSRSTGGNGRKGASRWCEDCEKHLGWVALPASGVHAVARCQECEKKRIDSSQCWPAQSAQRTAAAVASFCAAAAASTSASRAPKTSEEETLSPESTQPKDVAETDKATQAKFSTEPGTGASDELEIDEFGFEMALEQLREAPTPEDAAAVLEALLRSEPSRDLLEAGDWETALGPDSVQFGGRTASLAGQIRVLWRWRRDPSQDLAPPPASLHESTSASAPADSTIVADSVSTCQNPTSGSASAAATSTAASDEVKPDDIGVNTPEVQASVSLSAADLDEDSAVVDVHSDTTKNEKHGDMPALDVEAEVSSITQPDAGSREDSQRDDPDVINVCNRDDSEAVTVPRSRCFLGPLLERARRRAKQGDSPIAAAQNDLAAPLQEKSPVKAASVSTGKAKNDSRRLAVSKKRCRPPAPSLPTLASPKGQKEKRESSRSLEARHPRPLSANQRPPPPQPDIQGPEHPDSWTPQPPPGAWFEARPAHPFAMRPNGPPSTWQQPVFHPVGHPLGWAPLGITAPTSASSPYPSPWHWKPQGQH